MAIATVRPITLAWLLFSLLIIGGGTYAVDQIRTDNQDKDAVIRQGQRIASGHATAEEVAAALAQARAEAAAALERLDLFVRYPSSPEALAAAREEIYDNVINTIMSKSDKVLADIRKTSPDIQQQIATDRQRIQEILDSWKKLVSGPANNSPTAAAQATEYANELQTYIHELQQLVSGLTTENSGLTTDQIITDQTIVSGIISDIQQTISDLGQNTVPPSVVDGQTGIVQGTQTTVGSLEETLNDINSTPSTGSTGGNTGGTTNTSGNTGTQSTVDTSGISGTSGSGGTQSTTGTGSGTSGSTTLIPGTRYVLPLPPNDPNKPKLIEGANMDI